MSLPQQRVLYKEKFPSNRRLRPIYAEGRYIRVQVFLHGLSLKKIADSLGVSRASIHCVIYGKRLSARIESEIANILGKASWNDVVLEARSEVQKKPVELILREMEQRKDAANKASKKRMRDYIERDVVSSDPKARRGA